MMGHHHLHLHRPLPSSSSSPTSSSSFLSDTTSTSTPTPTPISGPTCCCGANEVYNPNLIYSFHHRTPEDLSLATAATNSPTGGSAAFRTAFHPFYVSPTASESPEMAAALGHPFTSAQWKELQRQAMIYKYMVASVPVPPDLLQPLTPNSTASLSSSLGNGSFFNLNLRFADGNKDPEPGRCKRTDGKKWRCSRDVAPSQKYCERHMNKGRSRSRKPVESQQTPIAAINNNSAAAHKRNRLLPPSPAILPSVPAPQFLGSGPRKTEAPPFLNKIDQNQNHLSGHSYKEPNRELDWGLRSEMPPLETSDQQWNHMLQRNMGFGNQNGDNTSVFNQECNGGSLNLIPYTDYADDQRPSSCNFFNRSCLQPHMEEEPRDFIDLWSNKNPSKDNNSSSVSLTLSMETASGDNDQIQMGLGVGESEKPQLAGWPSPVSWASSAPGGPLAEVLQSTVSSSYSSNAAPAASEMMMPFQWLT